MGRIEPRTDWVPGDGILADDFNRIEGNIEFLINKVDQLHTIPPPPKDGKNYGLVIQNGELVWLDNTNNAYGSHGSDFYRFVMSGRELPEENPG